MPSILPSIPTMSRPGHADQHVTISSTLGLALYGIVPEAVGHEHYPAAVDGEYYLAAAYFSIAKWVLVLVITVTAHQKITQSAAEYCVLETAIVTAGTFFCAKSTKIFLGIKRSGTPVRNGSLLWVSPYCWPFQQLQ